MGLTRQEKIGQLTCLVFTISKNAMGECLDVQSSSGISSVRACFLRLDVATWTWTSMMESMSTMKGENLKKTLGICVLVIHKEYWERALNQAQHEHERKRATHQDVHGENQNTFEQTKVKVPPTNLTSLPKRSVNRTKPHIVLFVPGAKFASRPRAQTEDTRNS